jgi:hypothetical protein
VYLRSEFHDVKSVTISAWKRCSVRFYLQLFVGGVVSYLFSIVFVCGVQHILCCVIVLMLFVLCSLCCRFLWHFWLPLRYSVMFIHGLNLPFLVKWCSVMQVFYMLVNCHKKMFHTVGKINTANTHINDRSLFWLGTSIKGGGVKYLIDQYVHSYLNNAVMQVSSSFSI